MLKRQLGIVLILLSVIVLFGAALAYAYTEFGEEFVPVPEPHFRGLTTAPYRDYVIPLILGSIALFAVGCVSIVRPWQNKQEL